MTFKLFIRTRVVPLHYLPLRPFHWMLKLTPTGFYIPFSILHDFALVYYLLHWLLVPMMSTNLFIVMYLYSSTTGVKVVHCGVWA